MSYEKAVVIRIDLWIIGLCFLLPEIFQMISTLKGDLT